MFCEFRLQFSFHHARRIPTCLFEYKSNDDSIILGSKRNSSILGFSMHQKQDTKFIPRHIGMKFPNLEELIVCNSSLEIIHSFYFDNMRRVQFIDVSFNQIIVIEKRSFKDLFYLKYLLLGNNKIETLERDLFTSMVNLKNLDLAHNRISELHPTTFQISGGKQLETNLLSNVCLNENYEAKDFVQLEDDIISFCQPD